MPKRLTLSQRDRLLDRIDYWRSQSMQASATYGWETPGVPCRRQRFCDGMATRLRVYIAGCGGLQWSAAFEAIERRRKAGELTGHRYVEALKWLGLREWGAELATDRRAA